MARLVIGVILLVVGIGLFAVPHLVIRNTHIPYAVFVLLAGLYQIIRGAAEEY